VRAAQVKTITALALAAMAEAASPYGIESFDAVLDPLWKGIRLLKGKVLAAYLKAIGHVIPLMDAYYAKYYTQARGRRGGLPVSTCAWTEQHRTQLAAAARVHLTRTQRCIAPFAAASSRLNPSLVRRRSCWC